MISEDVLDKKRNNTKDVEKTVLPSSIREEATMMNSIRKWFFEYIYGMWTLYDYERANVEYACALSNY